MPEPISTGQQGRSPSSIEHVPIGLEALFDISILNSAWSQGLEPDPVETVSEWAEKYRILPRKGAAAAGPWSNAKTPYLVEIMDAMSASSPIQKGAFMKGSQIGGTEAANNSIGYWMHRQPAPILMVQPTVQMAKRVSKQRISPMIQSTPVLRALVGAGKASSRTSSDTQLEKDFPGGMLMLSGSNAASPLASTPVRDLICDEPDRYAFDADGEGDPIGLAEQRTVTFEFRRKILLISTPGLDETSRIKPAFLAGDQRYYNLPCPHPGEDGETHFFKLIFADLIWDHENRDYSDVHFRCPVCRGKIYEIQHKTSMLARGKWIAENAKKGQYPSWHLSQLYSPFGNAVWRRLAQQWDDIGGNVKRRKVFVNTVLGETWIDNVIAPDWEVIKSRAGGYDRGTVPAGIVRLTIGGDVGQDHVEMYVWGWGRNGRRALIDWIRFEGPYNSPETWEGAREFIDRQYPLVAYPGVFLQAKLSFTDTSDWPDVVRAWVKAQNAPSRIRGCRGDPHARDPNQLLKPGTSWNYDANNKKIAAGSLKVTVINVSALKLELYGALTLQRPKPEEIPANWVMLPNQTTDEICRQLTAENLIREDKKGRFRSYWDKIPGRRNEALDCHNYARAAASVLGWDRWKDKYFDTEEAKFAEAMRDVRRLETSKAAAQVTGMSKKTIEHGDEPLQERVESYSDAPKSEKRKFGVTVGGDNGGKKRRVKMPTNLRSWTDDD
jgi:phage terminase large subunit GpA-like protein